MKSTGFLANWVPILTATLRLAQTLTARPPSFGVILSARRDKSKTMLRTLSPARTSPFPRKSHISIRRRML